MSKTDITRGWPRPKGKCDMCNDKPAQYWFGDTSVALCGDEKCSQRNKENWDRLVAEELNEDADDFWLYK